MLQSPPKRSNIDGGKTLLASRSDAWRMNQEFRFGEFRLQPRRQALYRREEVIRIGGRAFDLLTALVERAGEVVSKRELIDRAWPDIFVDDANLKVNMVALRRALGDRTEQPTYIATVAGRGYRFIESVEDVHFSPAGRVQPAR